jgi:hypothetical protein
MRSDTEQRIQDLIREKGGIRAREMIWELGLNPTGIFKHLKRLQKKNVIYKVGRPPEVRYYPYASMDDKSTILTNVMNWAISGDQRWASPDHLSSTRDVFQARTDHLVHELQGHLKNTNLVSLIVAIVGEVGNNSFDHNLGHWRDVPGVYFQTSITTREIVLADRGQGVFETIRRVKLAVKTDADALRVAFTEIVSGRAPEKRGNGLKFVKKVVEEQNFYLTYYTGNVVAEISASGFTIEPSKVTIPGTAIYIKF